MIVWFLFGSENKQYNFQYRLQTVFFSLLQVTEEPVTVTVGARGPGGNQHSGPM